MGIENLRRQLSRKQAEQKILLRTIKQEKENLITAKKDLSAAIKAQKILQEVAQTIQQQAHKQISNVVSKCLTGIFGENAYQFRIEFEQKRGKTEARIALKRGREEFDPRSEVGGGVLDVAAFALRVSALVLHRPPLRRILILDEPFKNLRGQKYRSRLRDLIIQLSEELEIQFIINIDVDQYPEFRLGKVIEVQNG